MLLLEQLTKGNLPTPANLQPTEEEEEQNEWLRMFRSGVVLAGGGWLPANK